MIIERLSPFRSNVTRVRDIDVTEEQLKRWEDGELIQDVMPHLTLEEREFIMTGMTEDDWEDLFDSDRDPK